MLTIKQVNAAKPRDNGYKLSDRDGLYLYVSPSGAKSWRANFRSPGPAGKTVQKTRTYGQYPELALEEARSLHLLARIENKRIVTAVAAGTMPAPGSVPTFKEVMRKHLRRHLPTLKNPKHRLQYETTLERWVVPVIGDRLIDTIKRKELVELVQAIQKPGAEKKSDLSDDRVETAYRVAGRINAVFNFAVDSGDIESHPAANLSRVLNARKVKKPMASVGMEGAGKLMADLDTYPEMITRLALKFMARTFGRVSELLLMEWDEIVWDDAVWVAPEEHVKGEEGQATPHVVPLSRQSLELLREVQKYTGDCRHVFDSPANPGHSLSENTLLFALYRLGYKGAMTVHGFRAMFSTTANQLWPGDGLADKRDVIEKQLNHGETNEVRAAYNRAKYLPQRRVLMQWYSDWLDEQHEAARLTSARQALPTDTRELSPA